MQIKPTLNTPAEFGCVRHNVSKEKMALIEKGKAIIFSILILGILTFVGGVIYPALSGAIVGTGGAGDGMKNMSNTSFVPANLNFMAQIGTFGTIGAIALLVTVVFVGVLFLFKKKGGF